MHPPDMVPRKESSTHCPPKIRLVLPHYNGIDALKSYLPQLLKALETHSVPAEVKIVDDGSSRLVQKLIESSVNRLASSYSILMSPTLLERNYGKGFAIRQGWKNPPESIEILAFVDSDGSVPATAVAEQLLTAISHPEILQCGVRPQPSKETRSWKRRIMGGLFAALVHKSLAITVSDPQCGFKMVPAEFYARHRRRFKIDRFAFDCELLTLAAQNGVPIVEKEVPWVESPTSTVRAIRDGFKMWKDVRALKKRLKHYSKPMEF